MLSVQAGVGLALCGAGFAWDRAWPWPLLAQADPAAVAGGSYVGVGMVLGGLVTAIGASFFQPWLKERKTQERLADALERIKALEETKAQTETKLAAAVVAERTFMERLSRLADKNTKLTDMNLRLATSMLIEQGRQKAGAAPTAESLLIGDDPPPEDGPGVLVVDDSGTAREAVRQVLELRGCAVEAVPDLPEALEALERLKPDYMILDLMLPSGDGIEALRRVRDLGLSTRVIVTTGKLEHELAPVRALRPLGVFTKPFDIFADVLPLIRKPTP